MHHRPTLSLSLYAVLHILASAEKDVAVKLSVDNLVSKQSTCRLYIRFRIGVDAVAAPTTCNSLPLHIHNTSSIFGFHCQLKTFLYKLAFDPS